MRRLPIFLVIDVSESMVGMPLRTMQEGITRLINELRKDPHALETVYLSIIGFAGIAKSLTPLVELMAFYPPRLPIGSGTSLGKALHHLMDEIDRQVIKNSVDKKGDWKPIVYLMSDGKSTDNPYSAIERWKNDYAKQANLISIGIGQYADLSVLHEISHCVLRLEDTEEKMLRGFIQWVTQSIVTQSRSVGMDKPISLEKKEVGFALSWVKELNEAMAIDEPFVILSALCRQIKLPYILKYEKRESSSEQYILSGVYPLESDYQDWSESGSYQRSIAVSQLIGGAPCPHCQAYYSLVSCGCGQIFCFNPNDEQHGHCPACYSPLNLVESDEDFSINRSRG
ncbi:MAG: TerY-C metal binding domain-containing protein [Cardiobacteriaceae bacterium]|nr:TerY-C metal binding domain-containing protein [Cardiobacteriaceae bacterium]